VSPKITLNGSLLRFLFAAERVDAPGWKALSWIKISVAPGTTGTSIVINAQCKYPQFESVGQLSSGIFQVVAGKYSLM
jgi:hypothetical protein